APDAYHVRGFFRSGTCTSGQDVRGARRRGGKGGQKPPLHMPVTVGANRPMQYLSAWRCRRGSNPDPCCSPSSDVHARPTKRIGIHSATPRSTGAVSPTPCGGDSPRLEPRVDFVHTCVTLEANEKPQRGWHHLRRDMEGMSNHVPGIVSGYYPIVNPSPEPWAAIRWQGFVFL